MVTRMPVFDEYKNIKIIVINSRDISEIYELREELSKELESHPWPGNIRQFKNVIENMVVVNKNEYLQLNDLPWGKKCNEHFNNENIEELSLQEQLERYERVILEAARKKHGTSRVLAC